MNSILTINDKDIGHIKFINDDICEVSRNNHTINKNNEGIFKSINKIVANTQHVCKFNNNLTYRDGSKSYEYTKQNCDELFFNNLQNKVYLNRNEIKNISSFAEIGVRYGGSYKEYSKQLNESCHIYLFEKLPLHCSLIRTLIDERTTLFEGEASETLTKLDKSVIFDYVFFDASHHYKTDRKIFDSLVKHITKNTTIFFDDYQRSDDVKKLVDEVEEMNLCKIKK